MMELIRKYQNIIAIVLFVVGAFIAYTFFTGGEEPVVTVESVGGQPGDSVAGQELLNLLLTLKGITLPDSVFASPAFQALEDFSQPIPPIPIGRKNPFEPIGTD